MYRPSLKDFLQLGRKGNLIPLYKEVNVGCDTPVSAFLKICKDDYCFLLESVEGQEKIARYSFLGSKPELVFMSRGRNITLSYPQKKIIRRFRTRSDPLFEIKKIMQSFRPVPVKALPRFWGGMVGYLGYDCVRFFEDIPDKNPDELKANEALFILTDNMLIFDHLRGTIKIVSYVNFTGKRRISRKKRERLYDEAVAKIESLHVDLKSPVEKGPPTAVVKRPLSASANFPRSGFYAIVKRAKEEIRKGEIIQVVLSQRFRLPVRRQPLEIYQKLRALNPSPYMFFLKLKELTVIGSSPEVHLRCEKGLALLRPIAGTRPRGRTAREDHKLEKELLRDKKEKAEHIMLLDLARNDLGRVAKKGKVKVSEFMTVEKYSHVMHLVSEVTARIDRKYDIYDCLRASFPAGTVSGSPKIRAMEIIDQLENTRRGLYAGCVGYFSFSGNTDTCITIRTIVIKGDSAYVQAGAGIVADSLPQREYSETLNKARALIEAVR